MNNQNQPLNQTQFSFEEPIFENPTEFEPEQPKVEEVKPEKSRKKLLIIFGAVVAVLLLILVLIVLIRLSGGKEITDPLRRDPTTNEDLSPLERRIEESRILLEAADPTKQDLSFPPIDFQLRLDPKED